jgi:hypothetical protein
MGSWHFIREASLRDLNPKQRAEWLYKRVNSGWDKPAQKNISRQLQKAMALELIAHFARRNMPSDLLRALAIMLELPDSFLDDPVPVFAGRLAQGKHADPRAREAAMIVDANYLKTHGKMLAVNALSKQLQALLRLEKPIARATLRKWRQEPHYASYVDVVGRQRQK